MKGAEQFFPVVLFILLWWFQLVNLWGMQTTAQYFAVVLFTMLYKVVLTFESVDEILMCDH